MLSRELLHSECLFFFSSRRRHTRSLCDWSSDVCSSDLATVGGEIDGTLNNCILTNNFASNGGGASFAALNNCTIIGNWATTSGGGVFSGALANCIAWYNTAASDENHSGTSITLSCTPVGTITSEPSFVDRATGNLR